MKNDDFLNKIGYISLFSTKECNQRCKYCYYFNTLNNCPENNMSGYEDAKYSPFLINKIKEYFPKFTQLQFWGAEPLLKTDELFKIIEQLRVNRNNTRFLMSTNFSHPKDVILHLLDKIFEESEYEDSLPNPRQFDYNRNNKYSIQISRDYPKEIHDLNRVDIDGNGTYDKIEENLLMVKEILKKRILNYGQLSIHTKPTKIIDNIMELGNFNFDEVFDYIKVRNKENMEIQKINKNVHIMENFIPDNAKVPYSMKSGEYYIEYFSKYFESFNKRLNEMTPSSLYPYLDQDFRSFVYSYIGNAKAFDLYCGAGYNQVAVHYNGDFYPCQRFFSVDKKIAEKYKIGNLLEDFIDNEKIKAIQEDFSILFNSQQLFIDNIFNPYYREYFDMFLPKEQVDYISNVIFNFFMSPSVNCIGDNIVDRKDPYQMNIGNMMKLFHPQIFTMWIKNINRNKKLYKEFFKLHFGVQC